MGKKKCTGIILAAGQGKRMGTRVQKQFLELEGKPVLYHTLRCFEDSALIDDIILVTGSEQISYCEEEIVQKYHFCKVRRVTAGGAERYHSVYEGLHCCENTDYVFIHDGARPFVDEGILMRTWEAVQKYDACIAAVPSKDTVKMADETGFVQQTPQRSRVWMVQTPQVFSYELIMEAYEKALQTSCEGITDDAMVVERMTGHRVYLAEGSYENIKLTTPEDLQIAKAFLEKQQLIGRGFSLGQTAESSADVLNRKNKCCNKCKKSG